MTRLVRPLSTLHPARPPARPHPRARAVRDLAAKAHQSEIEARRRIEALDPQHRFLRPGEVARVVVHLAAAEAEGINGQAWNLEGGGVTA